MKMGSVYPNCGNKNDLHQDRKNRFKFTDLFRFYIPGISRDIRDFKVVICSSCGKEYEEQNATLFRIPKRFSWALPLAVAILFLYMLYVAHNHGS